MLGQKNRRAGKEDSLPALCALLAWSGSSAQRNKRVQLMSSWKDRIRCLLSPEEVVSAVLAEGA